MSKLGTYAVNNSDYNSKIFRDSQIISSIPKEARLRFGTRVCSGKVFDEQGIIARCDTTRAGFVDNDNLFLDGINLSNTGDTEVVTTEEYSSIKRNSPIDGHRRYNPYTRYELNENSLEDNEENWGSDTTLGATYLNDDCPIFFIKYFNAMINLNETITLEYFVDTRDVDSINKGIIDRTFTLYVYDSDDHIIAKRTTYAGWYTIEIPNTVFTQYGETYISINCVDSRGVGSYTRFFDIYVKDTSYKNFYQMTASDLNFTYNGNSYTLVPNDNTELTAYKNKLAFTALLNHVKEDLTDSSGNHYNGIILYNAGNTEYWFSYYSDNNLPRNGHATWTNYNNPSLGTVTLYTVVVTRSGDTKTITDITTYSLQDILDNEDTIEGIYRSSSSGQVHKMNNDTLGLTVGQTTSLSSGTHIYIRNTTKRDETPTKGNGDFIILPDNFTIDLNNTTLRATRSFGICNGEFIQFNLNIDTHIINGKIMGNYGLQNMSLLSMLQSGDGKSAGEWLHTTFIYGSRYCSMENLEISYTVGYEAGGSSNAPVWGAGAWGYTFQLEQNGNVTKGAIGPSGNYVDVPTSLSMVRTRDDGIIVDLDNADLNATPTPSNIKYLEDVNFGTNGGVFDARTDGTRYRGPFEAFMGCYDISGNLLKIIKTRIFARVKLPKHTYRVKLCCYYTPKSGDATIGMKTTSCVYNCILKNNYWHHCRTIALYPNYCDNNLYLNNRYENVGMEKEYKVTAALGDIEDAHWYNFSATIRGCKVSAGSEDGSNSLPTGEIQWLELTGNDNISVDFKGGYHGFYMDNCVGGLIYEKPTNLYGYPATIIQNSKLDGISAQPVAVRQDFSERYPVVSPINCEIDLVSCFRYLNPVTTKNGSYVEAGYGKDKQFE